MASIFRQELQNFGSPSRQGSTDKMAVNVTVGVEHIRLDGHMIDIALTEVQKAKREFY